MQYHDYVYGDFEISDPAVLELTAHPTLRRLQDVNVSGYPSPFYSTKYRNRFEHSVGVWYLLNRFGASREEQIAGLIHDVSHAVFSHCIDYAFEEKSGACQDYQDNIFEKFVRDSDLPEILARHGLDAAQLTDHSSFSLLETKLPDTCADRIDYCLRDAINHGIIRREDIERFLENVFVQEGKWIWRDAPAARWFAELFFKMNEYYSGFLAAIMFFTTGGYIQRALENGYITQADLFTTDQNVLEKIKQFHSQDDKLRLLWDRMNGKIRFWNDPSSGAQIVCKSRVVDPWCMHNNAPARLSSVQKDWLDIVKTGLKPKEYFIQFESVEKYSKSVIARSETTKQSQDSSKTQRLPRPQRGSQ